MLIKRSLDSDGCIDLLAVMRIMNQISQEQAWALAYELAALMQRLWPAGNNCLLIENLAQIHINHEGWIHSKSLLRSQQNITITKPPTGEPEEDAESENKDDEQTSSSNNNNNNNNNNNITQLPPTPPITPELEALNKTAGAITTTTNNSEQQQQLIASSEPELVGSLGIALFWALDYGLAEDEERKLSAAMEYLIMQSQNPEGHLSLSKVQEICIKRLPVATKLNADKHYRTLCKSLIADTLELSKLLDKIDNSLVIYAEAAAHLHHHLHHHHHHHHPHHKSFSTSPTNHQLLTRGHRHLVVDQHLVDQDDLSELGLPLAYLKALKINDWARLWMQVNRELRQRRKFNQIHHRMHEYEFHSERKTTTTTTTIAAAATATTTPSTTS